MPKSQQANPINHDPAPWQIEAFPAYGHGDADFAVADWAKIYAANGDAVVGDMDVSTPEGKANALLVEQAPNLLSIVRQFLVGFGDEVALDAVCREAVSVLNRIEGEE